MSSARKMSAYKAISCHNSLVIHAILSADLAHASSALFFFFFFFFSLTRTSTSRPAASASATAPVDQSPPRPLPPPKDVPSRRYSTLSTSHVQAHDRLVGGSLASLSPPSTAESIHTPFWEVRLLRFTARPFPCLWNALTDSPYSLTILLPVSVPLIRRYAVPPCSVRLSFRVFSACLQHLSFLRNRLRRR